MKVDNMSFSKHDTILPLSRKGYYQILLTLGWLFCLGYGAVLALRCLSAFQILNLFPPPGTFFFLECAGWLFMLLVFLRENHQQLGEIYVGEADFKPALFHFYWAMRLNPFHKQAYIQIGNILGDANQWSDAYPVFKKALKHYPDQIDVLNGFAFAHLMKHDWKNASDLFKRAYFLKRGIGLNQAQGIQRIKPWVEHGFYKKGVPLAKHKLQHDIAQLQYLKSQGELSEHVDGLLEIYQKAEADLAEAEYTAIAYERHEKIAPFYLHNLYYESPGAVDGKVLLSISNPQEAQVKYKKERYTCLDQVLLPEVLKALNQFCLKSTIWNDIHYANGYLGSNIDDGFNCPLLYQIADELRGLFPDIIGELPLVYMWAFKCDSQGRGVALHGDSAAVNVNFWITPDAANLNSENGGLNIYTQALPLGSDLKEQEQTPEVLNAFKQKHQASKVSIPYRQNRMVIFDSQLLHETDEFEFESDYANRRINITLLFGDKTLMVS